MFSIDAKRSQTSKSLNWLVFFSLMSLILRYSMMLFEVFSRRRRIKSQNLIVFFFKIQTNCFLIKVILIRTLTVHITNWISLHMCLFDNQKKANLHQFKIYMYMYNVKYSLLSQCIFSLSLIFFFVIELPFCARKRFIALFFLSFFDFWFCSYSYAYLRSGWRLFFFIQRKNKNKK